MGPPASQPCGRCGLATENISSIRRILTGCVRVNVEALEMALIVWFVLLIEMHVKSEELSSDACSIARISLIATLATTHLLELDNTSFPFRDKAQGTCRTTRLKEGARKFRIRANNLFTCQITLVEIEHGICSLRNELVLSRATSFVEGVEPLTCWSFYIFFWFPHMSTVASISVPLIVVPGFSYGFEGLTVSLAVDSLEIGCKVSTRKLSLKIREHRLSGSSGDNDRN